MAHAFKKAALGVLLVFLSACGGGGNSSNSTPVNIAGNWQFMGNSTRFGYTFTATSQINQTGSSISGTLNLSGSPCAQTADFSGTLNGTSLNATVNESGQNTLFTGTVSTDGNSLSGTYTAPSGGCTNGDAGTWSGSRISTLNGLFRGTLAAQNGLPANVIVKFEDDGGHVTGTATLTNSLCFQSLNLMGTVSGTNVELRGTEEMQHLILRGTLDPKSKSLALTYSVLGGSCAGESGKAILVARE
jgi:hypothetical protein